jgi:hypothetical protein
MKDIASGWHFARRRRCRLMRCGKEEVGRLPGGYGELRVKFVAGFIGEGKASDGRLDARAFAGAANGLIKGKLESGKRGMGDESVELLPCALCLGRVE